MVAVRQKKGAVSGLPLSWEVSLSFTRQAEPASQVGRQALIADRAVGIDTLLPGRRATKPASVARAYARDLPVSGPGRDGKARWFPH